MPWIIHITDNRNSGVNWFNGGASFPAGVYKILASGWYNHWSGGCPSPGCPDETGIDGCMNAWCNRSRSYGPGDLGMHVKYGSMDSPVRDLRVEPGVLKLNHPGGPIGIWDKDDYYEDNVCDATYTLEIMEGVVFGKVLFPDDDETSLFKARVTVTTYYKHSDGDIKYSYQYPSEDTNARGEFEVNVADNPFSPFSWDYWKFILYGGWNKVSVKVEACNGQEYCQPDIIYDRFAEITIRMHHHFTHELAIKDSSTSEPITGAAVTYYDGFSTLDAKITDINGRIQWADAHPLYITHQIIKGGYKTRTPIIDRRGIDVRWGCWQSAELLIDPLLEAAFVRFDKDTYFPDEVIHFTYDTIFRNNCRIKLYDTPGNLLLDYALGNFTQSPPEVSYAISGYAKYGTWIAKLVDSNNNEIANDSAHVGAQGYLSYDTSMRCTDKKIKISWLG